MLFFGISAGGLHYFYHCIHRFRDQTHEKQSNPSATHPGQTLLRVPSSYVAVVVVHCLLTAFFYSFRKDKRTFHYGFVASKHLSPVPSVRTLISLKQCNCPAEDLFCLLFHISSPFPNLIHIHLFLPYYHHNPQPNLDSHHHKSPFHPNHPKPCASTPSPSSAAAAPAPAPGTCATMPRANNAILPAAKSSKWTRTCVLAAGTSSWRCRRRSG